MTLANKKGTNTVINIYAYSRFSESAGLLAKAMGIKRIKHQGSRYKGGPRKTVINWGATELPKDVHRSIIVNRPGNVRLASNKLLFFQTLGDEDYVPEWTTSSRVAIGWIVDGHKVCCRTQTAGHSAQGLVLAEERCQVVNAPLYTKYIPKKDEYRVHVIGAKVVDIQRKARSRNTPDNEVNWQVRTHENGFVFARDGTNPPQAVKEVAVQCVQDLSLDFGGVDVIWNDKQKKAYVLEINTAPGIEGTTVQTYARELRKLINGANT